ncbi:thioredoxin domain-containing protein [Streptomyces sp. NPDC101110]|uniref:thioredoxin domain-containing protein n=1 Tax=Streptomyces sp. NPDC101110 TaxID=3366104 RepID=UPI0037F98EBA
MVRGGHRLAWCAAVVLALAGCGRAEGPSEQRPADGTAEARPAYEIAEELPEKLGADGTTITVGDPGAKVKVHLYEDPRCPVCEQFEMSGGPQLRKAMLERWASTEYTMASFLDDRVGGSGSKKAVNALRAALEQGKFVEYHEVLYYNQPEESVDGYTDARLLELAGQVEGLRSTVFDNAVKTMKYRDFVAASQKAYERAGDTSEPEGPGTPTAVINDKRITAETAGVLYDSTMFTELLRQIHAHPQEWEATTL